MKFPFTSLEDGVIPQSKRFFFAPPLTEQECKLFYYIPWCGYFQCTEKYYHKRNSYPYCLLIYVEHGMMHIEYRDYVFDAQAGDVILLDCNEPHCYSAYNGLRFYFIHFDGANSHELCQYFLNKYSPLLRSKNNPMLRNLLVNTIAFYDTNKYESIMETSMRVYKCIQLLFSPSNTFLGEIDNTIEKTLIYIHENIANKLTLADLSDYIHLSPSYFSRCFKRETGLPPLEYIINVRMNQAKLLLVTTNKSIGDIAYEIGYSSGISFSNVFTERIGCSPKKFRKLMR